jgi:hypothetical protein
MSEPPETDAETMQDEFDHADTDFGPFEPLTTVPADFAQELERERDKAREEALGKERELKSLISLYINEINTLNKKCENLFAALKYIANCGLSARHMEDIAAAFTKTTKL